MEPDLGDVAFLNESPLRSVTVLYFEGFPLLFLVFYFFILVSRHFMHNWSRCGIFYGSSACQTDLRPRIFHLRNRKISAKIHLFGSILCDSVALFICSEFLPRYFYFSLFTFLSSLSTYRGPETICSWCKDPLGVRYYSGNRKASVLRRKWTFFPKFLRLQHQSPQYAALRSQYLSKISENAVPADL